ncbi:c-type cytochrome [Falsiroseomonas sp. HW251]|uniref:c-type cytochrome n=1 Tax=Falsiroseomonas sp. HW251 TaxID=3390998 RepID=UPI003D30F698
MPRLLAAMLLLPSVALAQDAADGRRLAEQWCANCHRIAPDGPGPAGDAVPSFAAIAARPGRNADAISTFIRNPHNGMPDFGITLRQSQDLAAYILTQGTR